jgi:hypothetical protein
MANDESAPPYEPRLTRGQRAVLRYVGEHPDTTPTAVAQAGITASAFWALQHMEALEKFRYLVSTFREHGTSAYLWTWRTKGAIALAKAE